MTHTFHGDVSDVDGPPAPRPSALERFGENPTGRRNILRRQETALAIHASIETRIPKSLADLLNQTVRACGQKTPSDAVS